MEESELIPQISALIIYMDAELIADWKYGNKGDGTYLET